MKDDTHPIVGHSYAINTGMYVGEMFVFIEETEEFCFISIPKNINRKVPKDKFYYGMDNKIVEHASKITSKVFNLLKKQYTFNIENTK